MLWRRFYFGFRIIQNISPFLFPLIWSILSRSTTYNQIKKPFKFQVVRHEGGCLFLQPGVHEGFRANQTKQYKLLLMPQKAYEGLSSLLAQQCFLFSRGSNSITKVTAHLNSMFICLNNTHSPLATWNKVVITLLLG